VFTESVTIIMFNDLPVRIMPVIRVKLEPEAFNWMTYCQCRT
jgi:hypothetical protein